MNEYEHAFLTHFKRLNITDTYFPALARDALEAEYGGEVDILLREVGETALANPEKFAEELFRILGLAALQYYVTILKYAESGRFNPEEETELEKREHMIEEIIRGFGPGKDGHSE